MVNIDAPPVTQQEALDLTIYHLKMAATYFEAANCPKAEMLHQIEARCADHARIPALAWTQTIIDHYTSLEEDA